MFDIFNILDSGEWFGFPLYNDWVEAEVCTASGHLKGMHCTECDTLYLPKNALRSDSCPYHRVVSITEDGRWRTNTAEAGTCLQTMFLLPPGMEWFYRRHHPEYTPLPPLKPGGNTGEGYSPMEFIYPENGSDIRIPRMLDGSPGEIVFNLAHSNPETEVFWHLDKNFISSTRHLHQLSVRPEDGYHTMTAVDEEGYTVSVSFTTRFSL
jgi:penicillin-binding protein 1C